MYDIKSHVVDLNIEQTTQPTCIVSYEEYYINIGETASQSFGAVRHADATQESAGSV